MDNVVVYTNTPKPAAREAGLMSPAGVVSLVKWYIENYGVTGSALADYTTSTADESISGTWSFATAPAFTSTGAPFSVTSNTVVSTLNADLLDGYHGDVSSVANTYALRNASKDIYVNDVYFGV